MFLSAIAGVLVSDYYFVRRGYLDVKELYTARPDGPYYGTYGISWQAYAAYVLGISVNIVGFAGAMGADIPSGAGYLYNINFVSGFVISAGTYWIFTRIIPVPGKSDTWNEIENSPCNWI